MGQLQFDLLSDLRANCLQCVLRWCFTPVAGKVDWLSEAEIATLWFGPQCAQTADGNGGKNIGPSVLIQQAQARGEAAQW